MSASVGARGYLPAPRHAEPRAPSVPGWTVRRILARQVAAASLTAAGGQGRRESYTCSNRGMVVRRPDWWCYLTFINLVRTAWSFDAGECDAEVGW